MDKNSPGSADTPNPASTTQPDTTAGSGEHEVYGSDDIEQEARDRFAELKDKYAAASENVKNRYSAIKDRVSEVDYANYLDQGRDFVRKNPGKALLISVGVGFVIGMLLRRSRDDED